MLNQLNFTLHALNIGYVFVSLFVTQWSSLSNKSEIDSEEKKPNLVKMSKKLCFQNDFFFQNGN